MSHNQNLYKLFQHSKSEQEKRNLLDNQTIDQLKSFAMFIYENFRDGNERSKIFPFIVKAFILHQLKDIDIVSQDSFNLQELMGENEISLEKTHNIVKELANEIEIECNDKGSNPLESFKNICENKQVKKLVEQIAHIFIHAEKRKIDKKKISPTHILKNSH